MKERMRTEECMKKDKNGKEERRKGRTRLVRKNVGKKERGW
jgi:hypothetical protein